MVFARSLFMTALVAVALSGCGADVCVDVAPNATIIDVLHDEQNDLILINLTHNLSYCTGTDEKKYSVEQIQIDLNTAQVTFKQRYVNDRGYGDEGTKILILTPHEKRWLIVRELWLR